MNPQSVERQLCARPCGAGRAKPEVSEQRPREIASWMQILITGPFAAITLDGPPIPPSSAPMPLASPIVPVILRAMDMFHWGLSRACQEKQTQARNRMRT